MLAHGKPVKPFNIEIPPPFKGNVEIVDKLKELSFITYGKDKAQVDEEIMKKYAAATVPPATPPGNAPLIQH